MRFVENPEVRLKGQASARACVGPTCARACVCTHQCPLRLHIPVGPTCARALDLHTPVPIQPAHTRARTLARTRQPNEGYYPKQPAPPN